MRWAVALALVIVVVALPQVGEARPVDRGGGGRRPSLVLGGSSESGTGLGRARPRRIWLGGDVSTTFFRLRWTGWGRSVARARGRSFDVPPYRESVPARLRAYRVGTCSGRRAYLRISVSKFTAGRWGRTYTVGVCD